jgi:hypothetical protein
LIPSQLRKEGKGTRSKEDLAQEAALVLRQAYSVNCFTYNLNRKYNSLPNRRRKSKHLDTNADFNRRRSEEISITISDELFGTPTAKKKALEWSTNNASLHKIKQTISKLFSPKLERKYRLFTPVKPLSRSYSDVGSYIDDHNRSHRKRSGSESENFISIVRIKKPLSPIIESSSQLFDQKFHFDIIHEAKKSKQEENKLEPKYQDERIVKSVLTHMKVIPIQIEKTKSHNKNSERDLLLLRKNIGNNNKADKVNKSMLYSNRYDQLGKKSTIHKMIHRLSNDCSPPPQLARTMVTPASGFGHNNNRPFSYTRPNESSPLPPQTDIIYSQIQLDKKKFQRSYSDSDEGLGLERKDSSRENSPAEKEYPQTNYYANDLKHNNKFNNLKSLYDDEKTMVKHLRNLDRTKNNFVSRSTEHRLFQDLEDVNRNSLNKGEKNTSTIFVDTSNNQKAEIIDSKHEDNSELISRLINDQSGFIKTSELSARRDLLESRIKSRLLVDENFLAKTNLNLPKTIEHDIIDKPIVPSPVTPNRLESPKRYIDTYISEKRMNSNGEKYIFQKEIHEDSDKVYGYEKKITNKVPIDRYLNLQPKEDYTIETHANKYGDKYIIETLTHSSCGDNFNSVLKNRNRKSPEKQVFLSTQFLNGKEKITNHTLHKELKQESLESDILSPPDITIVCDDYSFPQKEVILDNYRQKISRKIYEPKLNNTFEMIKGKSKSTQRLDNLDDNIKLRSLEKEHMTRSYENLTSASYVNAVDIFHSSGNKERSPFDKDNLDKLQQDLNDDYDTDISQVTNSLLDSSKYYKKTRTMQRYLSSKQDDYDSSPPSVRIDRNNHCASRYDSDITTRDTILCETSGYANESHNIRKDHQRLIEDSMKQKRQSRNTLDCLDDSNARESYKNKLTKAKLEIFDEIPQRPPRICHESKIRHTRHEMCGYIDQQHRDSIRNDPDRKDRLTDSGIENDYRRDLQEVDSRREPFESEDEGFVTMEFIKQERQHTNRNMNLNLIDKSRFNKLILYQENQNTYPVTSKPPSGADIKKYEKKILKKNGTMNKVKELFRKKEKKVNEEKYKKSTTANNSGTLRGDEVTMRYREYRGDQLRSAKSTQDFENEINEVS